MNRRSPASRWKPSPIGAVCACALTVGTNKGPPTVDNTMAIIVTIAHRFDERARRHVKGLERLMISSRHLSEVPHCHTVNWSMVWHRRSSSLSVVKTQTRSYANAHTPTHAARRGTADIVRVCQTQTGRSETCEVVGEY